MHHFGLVIYGGGLKYGKGIPKMCEQTKNWLKLVGGEHVMGHAIELALTINWRNICDLS